MNYQRNPLLRRILSVLLCVAMLLAYVILPVRAQENGTEETAVEPVAKQLTAGEVRLFTKHFNAYTPGETVLILGGWLQTLAGYANYGSLNTMYDEHVHITNLLSRRDVLQLGGDGMKVSASYNEDGSVTLTQTASTYHYAQMNYGVSVDLAANPYIYVRYSNRAYFNAIIHYDVNGVDHAARISYIAAGSENDYAPTEGGVIVADFAQYLRNQGQYPANGNLTINSVQYFVSGRHCYRPGCDAAGVPLCAGVRCFCRKARAFLHQ